MSLAFPRRSILGDDVWDAFVSDHPNGWFFHTSKWLDYCLAYHPDAADHSFGVTENGTLVAVVPLIREGAAYLMGGNPGMGPLFKWDVPPDAWTGTWRHIGALAHIWRMVHVAFRGHPGTVFYGMPGLPSWTDISWKSYVVDLTIPEETRWSSVRKSYHSLIRSAMRDPGVSVTDNPFAVALARKIHIEVAGRETRPVRTWELTAEWARQGHVLMAHTEDWSAFAMAYRWKTHAYYASGASKRPNLSHALQWTLMDALRSRHSGQPIETYEIGWAAKPDDSEKAKGIAMFKSGFGGALVTVPAMEWLRAVADPPLRPRQD